MPLIFTHVHPVHLGIHIYIIELSTISIKAFPRAPRAANAPHIHSRTPSAPGYPHYIIELSTISIKAFPRTPRAANAPHIHSRTPSAPGYPHLYHRALHYLYQGIPSGAPSSKCPSYSLTYIQCTWVSTSIPHISRQH